jgi:hypothetical protein
MLAEGSERRKTAFLMHTCYALLIYTVNCAIICGFATAVLQGGFDLILHARQAEAGPRCPTEPVEARRRAIAWVLTVESIHLQRLTTDWHAVGLGVDYYGPRRNHTLPEPAHFPRQR